MGLAGNLTHMPYARPTLRELARQGLADMASALGTYAVLRASPLAAVVKAAAGLVDGLYGYLDWIARQAVPATAEGEFLVAWAALVGITRKGATAATGSAAFTGAPGSVLPEATRIIRADGVVFVTTALRTVDSGGSVTAPMRAETLGAVGNGPSGASLVIATSVVGVNASGASSGLTTGGADEEEEEEFRQRMLDRFAAPPQGGTEADYRRWALEVPGVTRAWVTPGGAGAGTVVIYVMLDSAQAAFGGFPQGSDGAAAAETRAPSAAGDQLAVADYIFPLRPATALVYVVAPVAYPVDVRIADLAADTAETRAAITEALRGMFRRQGAPGGSTYQSDMIGAIAGADGVSRFSLLEPAGTVTAPAGALPVLGSIAWGPA